MARVGGGRGEGREGRGGGRGGRIIVRSELVLRLQQAIDVTVYTALFYTVTYSKGVVKGFVSYVSETINTVSVLYHFKDTKRCQQMADLEFLDRRLETGRCNVFKVSQLFCLLWVIPMGISIQGIAILALRINPKWFAVLVSLSKYNHILYML